MSAVPDVPDVPGEHTRILFLANNPVAATHPLDLDAEAAVIRHELEKVGLSHRFPLYAKTSATLDDLHEALLRARNVQVLHLAGHGTAEHGLLGVNAEGQATAFSGERLGRVLRSHPHIELVILGACWQLDHARALAEVVPCVVGTTHKLGDQVARSFSRAFYKGLAFGYSVGNAFTDACAIAGIDHREQADVIQLFTRATVDPCRIRIRPVQEAPEPAAPPRTDDPRDASQPPGDVLDGTNDVVVTANLVSDWRPLVPLHPHATPHEIVLRTDSEAWQRDYPPAAERWRQALQAVREGADEVKACGRLRVHVVAKLPYSLGAVLGSALEQQGREIVYYQYTPSPAAPHVHDLRTWQPWGPGLVKVRSPQKHDPVFHRPILPSTPIRQVCEVALLLSVTRPVESDLAVAAIGASTAEVRRVHLVPVDGVGHASIDQRNVDQAASQVASVFEQAVAAYPEARALHVFYVGPLALLMRAAGRLHLLSKPIYFYEWFPQTPTGPRYVRVLELGRRELVLPLD